MDNVVIQTCQEVKPVAILPNMIIPSDDHAWVIDLESIGMVIINLFILAGVILVLLPACIDSDARDNGQTIAYREGNTKVETWAVLVLPYGGGILIGADNLIEEI